MRWHWYPAATLPPPDRDRLLADALAGCHVGEVARGPVPGGRAAALRHLAGYDLADYGRSRNFLESAVSRLSPYLRHGMLTLPEVRAALTARYGNEPARLEEYLRQLAWRDFFEKVLDWHGAALHEDIEEPKHNVGRADALPPDIAAGRTGLPCMDGILANLFDEGYLHNHERLWFAAYLCHFRGVSWKLGARLFRQYLTDGDVASNSSSWQWVESSFAAKPYFMNQENIAKYSGGKWCRTCRVPCPFRKSYEALQEQLFNTRRAPLQMVGTVAPPEAPAAREPIRAAAQDPARCDSLVWVHDAALSPDDAALKANPGAAVVYAFDEPALRAEPWAFRRLAFVFDGVLDLYATAPNPVREVTIGDPATDIADLARRLGAKTIHLTDHPNPWVRATAAELRKSFRVNVVAPPVFADYAEEPRRFSRYWNKVAKQVLGHAPKGEKKFNK